MNQTALNTKPLKARVPLIVLAAVSLFGNVLYLLSSLIDYVFDFLPNFLADYLENIERVLEYGTEYGYFDDLIYDIRTLCCVSSGLLANAVIVVAGVLLLLYAIKLHGHPKSNRFEAAVFGVAALYFLASAVSALVWLFHPYYSLTFSTFFALFGAVFFTLAAVDCWRGVPKKRFHFHAVITALLIGFLELCKQLKSMLDYLTSEYFDFADDFVEFLRIYVFSSFWFYLLGYIVLFVALLIFALKNKPAKETPVAASAQPEAPIAPVQESTVVENAAPVVKPQETSKEEALESLREQYMNGLINEEEYRSKRKKIMDRI